MPTNQTPAGSTPKSQITDLRYGGVKQSLHLGSVSKINLSSAALDSASSLQFNGNMSLLQNNGPIEALVIRDQASSEMSLLGGEVTGPGYIKAYFEVKVILGGFYD